MARVVVTGAQGFLGRPLVAALERDQRVEEIVAIDRRAASEPPSGRVRHVQRDVRDPALARDLAGAEALLHLAVRYARSAEAENVDGSRAAFEAAARAGVPTIVHASSAAAYGAAPDNPVPLTEEHPLRGVPSFYSRAKAAIERVLDGVEKRTPTARVVRMRPGPILGPGAPLLVAGRAYVTLSDFDPLVQFTWIDDVVDAFLAALGTRSAEGAFNVGAPGAVPASRVAELVGARSVRLPYRVRRRAASVMSRLRLPGGVDPGFVDTARYPVVVDSGRAERELGWRPESDCAATLRRFGLR